jgi:hypothetical protein
MATAVDIPVTLQRRLFTVAEYAQMLTAGILSEDDRVELIDGEVRVMSPIAPLHAALVDRLTRTLYSCVPPRLSCVCKVLFN